MLCFVRMRDKRVNGFKGNFNDKNLQENIIFYHFLLRKKNCHGIIVFHYFYGIVLLYIRLYKCSRELSNYWIDIIYKKNEFEVRKWTGRIHIFFFRSK